MTIDIRLTCCGGVYAHKAHCAYHRHSHDGPPECAACRDLAAARRTPAR